MNNPCRIAAVAGTTEVAKEILALVGQIFGGDIIGTPHVFTDALSADGADLFICNSKLVGNLADKIPADKILGVEMIPMPAFFVAMAALPADGIRWVFCNTRGTAQVITDHCSQHGLPVDKFDYATFLDTPEPVLAGKLRRARYIVGVSALVGPGKVLRNRYGQYLPPDVTIIPLDRMLAPQAVADLRNWIVKRRTRLAEKLAAQNRLLEETLRTMEAEISQRRQIQTRLEYESTHDSLTEIYNRRFFRTAMDWIDRERIAPVAIVVVDLDGLKHINDTFGHTEGDRTLQKIAAILRQSFRGADVVARIGGDEFAAIMVNTGEEEVLGAVWRIKQLISNWVRQEDRFAVNVSTGYAIAADAYIPAEELFGTADAAMYADKNRKAAGGRRASQQ